MESRMHGNTHVRFGERDMENHHAETWHGVLSLLYACPLTGMPLQIDVRISSVAALDR